MKSTPTPFCGEHNDHPVFNAEREFIEKRRKHMFGKGGARMAAYPTSENNLVGLCLSGGGIRSATFNLGFMQALYKYKILHRVDYLSTVSGGGYIGSCLTALLNTGPDASGEKNGAPDLQANVLWDQAHFPFSQPAAASKPSSTGMAERAPVRHLRYFSNYLTAEGNPLQKYLGPVLAVTRGLFFNLLLIAPFIILTAALLAALYHIPEGRIGKLQINSTIAGMKHALDSQKKAREAYEAGVYNLTRKHDRLNLDERIAIVQQNPQLRKALTPLKEKTDEANAGVRSQWWAMLTIPVIGLGIMMVASFFFLVASKRSNLALRFRFSYRFSQILFVCLVLFAIQAFGAALVYWDHYEIPDKLAFISLLTFMGPRLLKSRPTGEGGGPNKAIVKILLSILLMALTPVVLLYFTGVCVNFLLGSYMLAEEAFNWINFAGCLLVGFGLLVFTNRWLNVNKISLHNFYRDRLCRAFIIQGDTGFNRPDRPFETVTPQDDGLPLSDLYADSKRRTGPYHILNANLNVKKRMPERTGQKHGRSQSETQDNGNFRKGESFIFSKSWCGSAKTGYIRTRAYEALDDHLDLGTAMAISGAAANVGMGDLPVLRMLMGLLNIRLGYWAPNPRQTGSVASRFLFGRVPGAVYAMSEWFGQYSLDGKFVNLSDGGHFDNIGVYELLRRRCKYIIVADAEADQSMKFQALSYLIRLARIDFDIHIDIDITNLKLDDTRKLSGQHCVMGTITYPENELNDRETGYLFYCKSSLTGDEPAHLNEYRVKHPSFPHQTTADQWFDEQQFEAYRELGYHIGKAAITAVKGMETETSMEDLFIRLKEFWCPRPLSMAKGFTRHAAELNRLMAEIKEDPDLAFMDAQMYPEWEELMATSKRPPRIDMWLPEEAAERRAGFYICSQMLQLMENVYIDLNLEEHFEHPDNRGWINLFMHWAWAGMFRVTWAISACTYGAKFQRFCERRLKLGESQCVSAQNLGGASNQEGGPGVQQAHELPAALSDEALASVVRRYLNAYEITKVDRHIEDRSSQTDANAGRRRSCYGFNLHVQNPLNKTDGIEFCFGFALATYTDDVVHIDYFRIQDHLRQMGLGRRAMEKLIHTIVAEQSNEAKQQNRYHDGYEIKRLENFRLAPWCEDRPDLREETRKLQNMLDSVITEIAVTAATKRIERPER